MQVQRGEYTKRLINSSQMKSGKHSSIMQGKNISEGLNIGQATHCPVSGTDTLCAVGSLVVSSSLIQSCVAGSIH